MALIKAISVKEAVRSFGEGTENRGDIEVLNNSVFYRGEKLFGEDVNRILPYLKDGYPHGSMIRFLEVKLRNVSPKSVEALYCFLENQGIPITDNGTILGYKGVRNDFYSNNSGAEPLISGIHSEDGCIRNQIGDMV